MNINYNTITQGFVEPELDGLCEKSNKLHI